MTYPTLAPYVYISIYCRRLYKDYNNIVILKPFNRIDIKYNGLWSNRILKKSRASEQRCKRNSGRKL